jgi:hypothetical protein
LQNPSYSQLAADERAVAASDAQQQAELADPGDGSGGSSGVVGGLALGTTAGQQVLTDCVSLGLTVGHTG